MLSLLTVFEGVGFALLFTSGVVIVGNLVPPTLRSTGQSISTMIGFGIGPILGAAAGGYAFEHLGAGTLYGIASILALTRVCVTFEMPSRQVFLYDLVGKGSIMNAIALNSGLFNASKVVGPALAGFCLAKFGRTACFTLSTMVRTAPSILASPRAPGCTTKKSAPRAIPRTKSS